MSELLHAIIRDRMAKRRVDGNTLSFVHVPKTAGTYIRGVLDQNENFKSLGHSFGREDVAHFGRIVYFNEGRAVWPTYLYRSAFRESIRFAIVREPVSWVQSYYAHNQTGKWSHTGWASVNDYHDFDSFEEFCSAFLDLGFPWHCNEVRLCQIAQCFDIAGKCRVDFLIYNERTDDAIDLIARTFGMKRFDSTGKSNKSLGTKPPVSTHLRDRLNTYFAPYAALLGYKPDGELDSASAILSNDGLVIDARRLRFCWKERRLDLAEG